MKKWNEASLRAAIINSSDWPGVFKYLGMVNKSNSKSRLKRAADSIGLDYSHLKSRKRSWTDEDLICAIKTSKSIAEVIKKLNLALAGSHYTQIKDRVNDLKLDVSHMSGQAWSRNLRFSSKKRPIEQLLIDGSKCGSDYLRKRLIAEGLKKAKCEGFLKDGKECNLVDLVEAVKKPLQLDHINGNKHDNRIENLRILCPIHHSLTPTFTGKNAKLKRLIKPA